MRKVKSSSSANLNLTLAMLIFVLIGCSSLPSNNPRLNNAGNTVNGNTNQPNPSPSLSPSVPPTPDPAGSQSPQTDERIKRGEAIYKRIASRTGLPIIFGWRAADVTIPVPTSEWNGLSKEKKVDLTYYAEHLVEEIKDNPLPYASRWADYYRRTEHLERGGEYDGLYQSSYFDQVRNLCRTCWSITIGKAKRDGFFDESTPVSGGTVQDFRAGVK